MRTIAVNAPTRQDAPFKDVPTLGELHVQTPSVLSGWTAILGPAKTTLEQVVYWEKVLAETMKTSAWKEYSAAVLCDLDYKNSA